METNKKCLTCEWPTPASGAARPDNLARGLGGALDALIAAGPESGEHGHKAMEAKGKLMRKVRFAQLALEGHCEECSGRMVKKEFEG